jgi:hypothetical protein
MSDAKNENWQDLCRAIQEEKNHDKLNELASQLNAALDEWTKSKKAPNCKEQRGSKSTSSQHETINSHAENGSNLKLEA